MLHARRGLIRALNFALLAQDLNLMTSSLAARALECSSVLNGLTLLVTAEIEGRCETRQHAPCARGEQCGARSNYSLDASGISTALIENLPHDAVVSRRVNSGVRFLLNDRGQTLESIILHLEKHRSS